MNRTLLISILLAVAMLMMSVGVGAASEVTLTLEGITTDPLPNHAMDVYVAGNYAYVADYTNGLVIVDISDPGNPTTVGNYPSRVGDYGYTAAAIGVAVSGNYVYVTNWYDDLYIIDVTDKTNPTLANTYVIADGADSITISGDLAFISAEWAGMDIIDISDPVNPVFLGNYNTNDLAEDVAIQNSYAYIADRDDGVIIVDVSNPSNPTFISSIDTPFDANSIVVSGIYAYVADADDTLIIDVSNPSTPAIVGQYDTTDSWGISYDGNYVYVGDGDNGVVVLNVSDPTNPVLAGSFDTAGFAGRLDIIGNFVYVADGPLVILRTDTSSASGPVHNINKGTDYTTIQAAIDDASPGDEIHVDSGTYYENVVVNKQLTLRGIDTGTGMPVVDAGGSGDVITISANRSILDGFIIKNSGLLDVNAGIIITSNDNVIKNNEVFNNKWGINLESSSNNIVEGNIVHFNSYPGIALASANSNIISNNEVNSNGYYGIELYLSSNNTVIDNIANSNTRYGIFVWESDNDNKIISNMANNNVNAGIRFYTSSNNNVSDNLFDSNNYGISIYGSSGNIISENAISFNGNGIFFDSSSNNVIYHNNITKNTHQASDNSGPNTWDDGYPSGGNYWSDYIQEDTKSGPNQDQSGSDGIGDTPYSILGDSSVDRYPLMAAYTPTPPPSDITIISPSGGEDWEAGTIKPIQWTYTNSPDTEVWIEILKDGWVDFRDLVPIGTNGHGFYEWKIEQSQPYGADYQVRITSYTDSTYTDTSNYFTISKPSTPMFVEITSPNNKDQIIEDIDSTFSSLISGGVPPYKFEWVDDKGNILSTSQNFNINFYDFYGNDIKIFDPEDIIFIDFIVTDANGAWRSDNTYVYVVPPAPKVEYEVWQNYEKITTIMPDKQYPYEIWVKVTNTDDNPHYYSLKLDTPPENDIPLNLWDAKTKTDIIKNDMQTKLIQPGSTRIFVFEFKSDWEWIPPKSMVHVYWEGSWGIFYTQMAKLVDPKLAIALTITDITDIVAKSKIGIPIVNFKFTPQYGSTPTLMGPNTYAEVPLYAGQTKVQFYRYYAIDKFGSKIGFLINPLFGGAAFLNSGSSYKKANDPVNDYTEIIQPEPFYVPEIDSIQNELHKRIAHGLFNILSYSKAEEISYIRYAGAIEDNEFEYALMQLEAAKKYNDICLNKLKDLDSPYKLIVEDLEPFTEEQIDEYKIKISNDGLPSELISILIREGLEDEIPELEDIILDSDPELLKDPLLLINNNNLKVRIRSDLSNEYMKEITEIKVDQLGQPISEATIFEIEEIETLKDSIQLGLDKGYTTQELKANIQSMLDLANVLIIRTNNIDYLHYYSFARDAQVKLLTLQMPINLDFLPPITTMDQYNLKDGSTLPIKFTARDSTTDEFIYDDTVNVTITNSTGHLITYFTNDTGTDSVRINSDEEQYIVNFDTRNYDMNVGEAYAITATFGESDSLRGYAIAHFDLIDSTAVKVPSLTPIGIIMLVGLLLSVVSIKISRNRGFK